MAGSGQRMKKNINKVLLPLGDKLIYEHSVDKFKALGFEVICVINPNDDIKKIDEIKYVEGGKTRSESVYNGLKAASSDYVFIHDAARPFISIDIIKKMLNNLNKEEAYLCYLNSVDTLKDKSLGKVKTINRDNIIRAVTPQCAPKWALTLAYEKAFDEGITVTDDISVLEKFYPKMKINLVLSNEENFKITTSFDYEVALMMVNKLWLE